MQCPTLAGCWELARTVRRRRNTATPTRAEGCRSGRTVRHAVVQVGTASLAFLFKVERYTRNHAIKVNPNQGLQTAEHIKMLDRGAELAVSAMDINL